MVVWGRKFERANAGTLQKVTTWKDCLRPPPATSRNAPLPRKPASYRSSRRAVRPVWFELSFPRGELLPLHAPLPHPERPPRVSRADAPYRRLMTDLVRQFRDFFVSLKLTVVLLVLGMVLVFASTLDQVNLGIWAVQEKWFRSFFVLQRVGDIPIPVFPGGYFIGGLLLINLVSAHIFRFKRSWKKLGIELTHAGLILLLLGELFTGLWQEEFAMRLEPGQPRNYSESFRDNELAIVDTTDPQTDEVVAIPERFLQRDEPIQHPKLPFRVAIKQYFPNSALRERTGPNANAPQQATQGPGGEHYTTVPLALTYKQNERNLPSAVIELIGADGSLGTWLVHPQLRTQTFQHAGRTYSVGLRYTRSYKPFTLTLIKFSHDRYAGTEIPKNFSSKIRLQAPGEDREVLIYMNNPLRYGGFTFYQASFDGPDVTILQVVRNPSWLIPYIACTMMTVGLLVQFGIHLVGFINRRRLIAATKPSVA